MKRREVGKNCCEFESLCAYVRARGKIKIKKEKMMEGRRISAANPRPCSGRRILAAKKRGRSDGFLNSVKKLQRREISSKPDRSFSITNAQERFRNMRLMVLVFLLFNLFSNLICSFWDLFYNLISFSFSFSFSMSLNLFFLVCWWKWLADRF